MAVVATRRARCGVRCAEVHETLATKSLSLGTSALHIHRRAMGPSHVVGVARQGSCRNPRHCESGAALRSEAGGNGDIETALHSGTAHPRGGPRSNKDWRGMECTPSFTMVILVTDAASIMVSKAQGCSKAILHSAVAPLTARSAVADGVGALARDGRTLAERWQHACNTRQHAMHYVLRAPKKATFVAKKRVRGGVRQRQRAPLQAGAHRCRTRFGLRSSESYRAPYLARIVYDGANGGMGLTEAYRGGKAKKARLALTGRFFARAARLHARTTGRHRRSGGHCPPWRR